MSAWIARATGWLLALVAGAVFGVAGTISHPLIVGGWLPLGMIVGGIACFGLLIAIRLLIEDRGAVIAAGLGMIVTFVAFSGRGPGGSVVVPQAAEGEVPLGSIWSLVLVGAVLLVCAWPNMARLRALSSTSRHETTQ